MSKVNKVPLNKKIGIYFDGKPPNYIFDPEIIPVDENETEFKPSAKSSSFSSSSKNPWNDEEEHLLWTDTKKIINNLLDTKLKSEIFRIIPEMKTE